jgi:hypothetical protein
VLSNFAAANVVIGQKDFSSNQCNQGGNPAADNLCAPEGAPAVAGGKLYIADSDDSRVLGFKKVPPTWSLDKRISLPATARTRPLRRVSRNRLT